MSLIIIGINVSDFMSSILHMMSITILMPFSAICRFCDGRAIYAGTVAFMYCFNQWGGTGRLG
jgi:hypothetical protein